MESREHGDGWYMMPSYDILVKNWAKEKSYAYTDVSYKKISKEDECATFEQLILVDET